MILSVLYNLCGRKSIFSKNIKLREKTNKGLSDSDNSTNLEETRLYKGKDNRKLGV
jgi:hypothetical protein